MILNGVSNSSLAGAIPLQKWWLQGVACWLAQNGRAAGEDKVKVALRARNMKVGGTPEQRAERLFKCAGKQLHELPPDVFVPGAAPALALPEAVRNKQLRKSRRVANVECKIHAVVESLGPVIDDTHAWVEKKLAQSYEELKQDIDRDDFNIGGVNDSDEVRVLCMSYLSY
jgi:splicing factor 3A subunit 3